MVVAHVLSGNRNFEGTGNSCCVDDFSVPHNKKGLLSVEVIPIYGIRNLNVLKRPHSNLALTGFVESAMTQMLANLLG